MTTSPPHLTLKDRFILKAFQCIRKFQERVNHLENERLKTQMKFCGHGVNIHGRLRLTGGTNMYVGHNVHIAENAHIRAEAGLTIGDNTHISRNLVLYTINHRYHGDRLPYDEMMDGKAVTIGKNVWIGMNVCITPGTTIGDGAIVGMGAVVSGTVPPLAIIGGQKWRILKYRDEEHYNRLVEMGQYAGPSGRAWVSSV